MISHKIIMITGYQRSGTNALLKSLRKDQRFVTLNESQNNEIFFEWNLRPETEIRSYLQGLNKPLIAKPVNETSRRSILELFDEYQHYDLSTIFIYRNPVNVYYSQLMKRVKEKKVLFGFEEFISSWNKRNSYILQALPRYKKKIFLVKYEDLINYRGIFSGLCKDTGIRGSYLFRNDSEGGLRNFPEFVVSEITQETTDVFQSLERHRSYKPSLLRKFL